MRPTASISPMKTLRKSRRTTAIALALSAGLLAGAITTPTTLRAQAASPADAASQKMQLMLQAIDARSSGDYAKARDLFAQLLALDPQDANLKKDVADMDAAIAAQSAAKPAASTDAAAAPTAAAPSAAAPATADPAPATADAAPAATTAAPAKPSLLARLFGKSSTPPAPTPEAVAALKAQTAKQNEIILQAGVSIDKASDLAKAGQYDDARTLLDQTMTSLPQGLALNDIRAAITQASANTWLAQGQVAYQNNQLPAARDDLAKYVAIAGDDSSSRNFQKALDSADKDPFHQDINILSPMFTSKEDKISQLLISGRAQYLYGDNEGALQTFDKVLINDPDNVEAKAYELKINQNVIDDSYLNQKVTRTSMLKDVTENWTLPRVYAQVDKGPSTGTSEAPEITKMKKIIIPRVNIDEPVPLDQVAATLKQLSEEYDPDGKGVNIIVYAPSGGGAMPKVSLPNLTNLSLDKLLTIACNQARPTAYSFGVEDTVVSLREGGGGAGGGGGEFETRDFALSEGTKTRFLGITGGGDSSGASASDPFNSTGGGSSTPPAAGSAPAAAAPAADASSAEPSASDIEDRLQSLFIRAAGADFPSGAKLAYVAGKIYVTNTPKNLDLIDHFLKKYSEVKQVEVEARFLDVTQGDLQEAGAQWNLSKGNTQFGTFDVTPGGNTTNNLRNLGNAFPLGNTGTTNTTVSGLVNSVTGAQEAPIQLPQNIPTLPNTINVGTATSDAFSGILGVVEGYKINLILDMLDQKQGDDLMSAPKITVLSQKDAKITVAQELRYPNTFGSIQSQVSQSSGTNGGGGSGGVTVTAGTPEDFQTEEIGVIMDVIPTVEEDDSITMHLEPKVTEFEGFIEYGGTSIAIQSGTVATVPSGFIQPIFDVRHIMTDVTIFDGATVVMGGLTRDEVKTVEDKVPILGDIPLIGRAFQSKGESSEKRNLMIFVTANLISPGGSLANHNLPSVPAGTVFSNPTVDTPAGGFRRQPENSLTTPTPAANQ